MAKNPFRDGRGLPSGIAVTECKGATRRPPLDCRRMVRPAANVSGQGFSTGSRTRQEALRGACARFLTIVPPIVVAFILLGFRLAKNASCVSLGQEYIFLISVMSSKTRCCVKNLLLPNGRPRMVAV